MYKVLKNEEIKKDIFYLVVEDENIASKGLPGQFVIVMSSSDDERIPLTIVDVNKSKNTVDMIYQVVGASTKRLSKVKDYIFALVGPLGKASEIVSKDVKGLNYVLIGGGIGIAPIYPQAKYLHEHGANVDIIYGARNKDLFILEEKLSGVCDNIVYITDDGSNGNKGMVTDALKKMDKKYDEAIVIGPMIMMKFVSLLTKEMNLKTTVSLNPIMVDGTGMCGACRVLVDGSVKFACVDGPEFDGAKVDFDSLIKRSQIYKEEEGRLYLKELEGDTHHGGCGECNHE